MLLVLAFCNYFQYFDDNNLAYIMNNANVEKMSLLEDMFFAIICITKFCYENTIIT